MAKLALALSAFLGVSLLVNVMTFKRLSNGEAPRTAPKKNGTAPAPALVNDAPAPVVTGDKTDHLIRELATLRREVAELKAASPSTATKSPPAGVAPSTPARDPEIAAILAEQDRFTQFWGDLGKLSTARKQIEENRYVQAVIDSTAQFIGLVEPQASHFSESAKAAIVELERANKEYQEAGKTIVHDRTNPKLYQEQWNAVNKRYKEAQAAATDLVKAQLDASQSRQKQFMSNLDGWFRYLAPVQAHRREGLKSMDSSYALPEGK